MGFIKRIFNSNGRKQEMAQRERTHATHAQLARNIETSFMKMDRERKSLFESRAGIETNPNREERDVLRISRPLNGDETGEPCELLSHQGVWLRNKNGSGPAFSFLNSGRRKGQGLKMTIEYDAEPEKNSWRLKDAEFAGKTRASDADAYNSCE
jgi:hypothetical protein